MHMCTSLNMSTCLHVRVLVIFFSVVSISMAMYATCATDTVLIRLILSNRKVSMALCMYMYMYVFIDGYMCNLCACIGIDIRDSTRDWKRQYFTAHSVYRSGSTRRGRMIAVIRQHLPVSAASPCLSPGGRNSTVVASSFMHAWGECTLERMYAGIKTVSSD